MTSKKLAHQPLTGLFATIIILASFVGSHALPAKVVGEVLVSNRGAKVTVNGEVAQSGRSLFSGSTIDTPGDSSAVVVLGSMGRMELGPNTSITLSFDESGISGSLTAGRLTVLSASTGVNVTTAEGSRTLSVGETAEAGTTQTSTAGAGGSNSWILWVAILGGAIAGIVLATSGSNGGSTGGGSTVSPTR